MDNKQANKKHLWKYIYWFSHNFAILVWNAECGQRDQIMVIFGPN